ncbi:MAG: HNH endonuclease [Bacteroidaceae bacterium]|nr:HNH endonuclease [Bacteroidaceae bacterium]
MERLGRQIETIDELKANLEQVERYLHDSDDAAVHEILKLIGNGTNFVAYQLGDSNEFHFAPSRFIGYLNNSLKVHLVSNNKDGRETSPRIDKILHKTREYDDELEELYLDFCAKIGAKPKEMRNTQRKYWRLKDVKIELFEGGVKQVSINRYERNPEARKRCIKKFGTKCYVCGMNFRDVYGEIGEGFIHVHHIISLFKQKKLHVIDEANLIPVCPNCHAMLHRGNVSVEELRQIVKQNKR